MDPSSVNVDDNEFSALLESMEQKILAARASFADQAFSIGCSALLVPMGLVFGLLFLFGVRSWAGMAIVAVMEIISALILAVFFATRSQLAAGKREFEANVLPQLNAYAADHHLSIEQVKSMAAIKLAPDSYLGAYIQALSGSE